MSEQKLEKHQMVDQIRIVEYIPELAEAVADMWNHSREGWGGGTSIMTGEQVRQREAQSGNKNLFLALEKEKVVGYCGLSEYREDEGALYIPLLNVRTDYHGKKIGKLLVLEALKKTIELGWPRLDLYTWAGNTKAVPLYKKCGFFWEDRDDTTHLMNFIPAVMQTEAVQDYFKEMDWYESSAREIEILPDGRKENGFDFYTYTWEHQQKKLVLEFERKGRGLRLIDTEDYYIAASLKQAECITGRTYQIEYHVLNKTNQPLDIRIEGENDRNIQFQFSASHQVEQELKIAGEFFVGPIEEEQSVWRTHPGVKANVWINGKKAALKLGVLPKLPAKMKLIQPNPVCYVGQVSQFSLNLENNVDQELVFSFTWPEVGWLSFEKPACHIKVGAKEKVTLDVPYTLKRFGFYEQELTVKGVTQTGEELEFTKRLGLSFQGIGAAHYGESEEYWHICHGLYEVKLSKFNNELLPGRIDSGENPLYWMAPQLGKPYSLEFAKKRPTRVQFALEQGAVSLQALYHSNDYPSVELVRQAKLYANGVIEHRYTVKNASDEELNMELAVNEPIYYALANSTFHYQDKLMKLDIEDAGDYSDWDANKVSERWFFSFVQNEARGICWSSKHTLSFGSWFFALKSEVGKLQAHEEVRLEPTFASLDAFPDALAFRRFALQSYGKQAPESPVSSFEAPAELREVSSIELAVNGHNPVVSKETKVELKLHKLSSFEGEVSLKARYEERDPVVVRMEAEAAQNLVSLDWQSAHKHPMDILEAEVETTTQIRKLHSLVLYPGTKPVECFVEKDTFSADKEQEIFVVQNGRIQFKAAPGFYPSIFSMHSLEEGPGEECLNTSYPKAKPKAWWNPWGGGIFSKPRSLSLISLLKEERAASFAQLEDQYGNVWQGIKVRVTVQQNEELKGLAWNQYYVTMPGLPLLVYVTEIEQKTQTYWHRKGWSFNSSLMKESKHPFVRYQDEDAADAKSYKLGASELEIAPAASLSFQRRGSSNQLQIVTSSAKKEEFLYNSKDVCELLHFSEVTAAHGQNVFLPPAFYLLHEARIPEAALADLKRIRFRKTES